MSSRHALRPSAFSLIEILIAVTVLALGLLGLGMVFPVVVRQQRVAQDSIQGLSAARSAAEYLRSRQGAVDALQFVGEKWYSNDGHTTDPDTKRPNHDGRWQVDGNGLSGAAFAIDAATGIMTIGNTATPQYIGIFDRLSPAPFTSPGGPQFVWDIALRSSAPGQVEVAVFTRRIDAGISIPTGAGAGISSYSLSHVLTGEGPNGPNTVPEPARRVPVAVDSKTGRPTLTGLDQTGKRNYSLLRTIAPVPAAPQDFPSLLRLNSTDEALLGQARQPGQKLVDNSGIIHTVSRASDDFKNAVILERPLSDYQRDQIVKGNVQFLMTPQVPAAVTVVTLQK